MGHRELWRNSLVGYARCSTDEQDLSAQRNALIGLGVKPKHVYVDHDLTGRNKQQSGPREASAACRARDTLVATKFDRLARPVRDAHEIADDIAEHEDKLSIGGSIHDSTDPTG